MRGISGWLLAFAGIIVFCLLLVAFVDLPLARLFADKKGVIPNGFSVDTEPFIAALDVVGLVCALRASRMRSLSQNGVVVILAACSSTIAYALVAVVMKPVFGRLSIAETLQLAGWQTGFVPLHGNQHSTFPSGHTAVAVSIFTLFWSFQPRYRPLYVIAIASLGLLLVWGGWHFISDVVAGVFVGVSSGFAVCAVWGVVGKRVREVGADN
jgi:membrane-associated phospholipid phosphatase